MRIVDQLAMKTSSVTPIDRAQEFRAEELFFSTTDHRGVIQTANDVFFRVAAYDEAQMIGQPHNLIRHPDMPRAAFKLMWQLLHAGKPVAVFVKNLAHDGAYYWVLAMIAPIEGGFISVRSKPCSSLLPVVEKVYRDMVAVENGVLEKGGSPAAAMTASTKVLLEAMKGLGFTDYEEFVAHALLPQELAARKAQVGTASLAASPHSSSSKDGILAVLERARPEMQRVLCQLQASTARLAPVLARNASTSESSRLLTRQAEGIGLMAMNVGLRAVQLGEIGHGTGVIANFLGEGAAQLRARVDELARRLQSVTARLGEVVVEFGWGELEYEMVIRALDEVNVAHRAGTMSAESLERRALGLSRLRLGVMGTRARMTSVLAPFLESLSGIGAIADTATECAISLGAAHVGGRVESARLASEHSMDEILGDLRVQLDGARARLEEIKDSVAALTELRSVMSAAERVVLDGASALERHTRALEAAFEGERGTSRLPTLAATG
jgi:aerotaxis receptor